MAFVFPALDPVAISVGPISIHWYALSYIAGIVLSCAYGKYLLRRYSNGVTPEFLDGFAYGPAIIGIIVGGRLGHVLFYTPLYYMHHPLEILMTWQGGMSFHGGLLGVLTAAFIYGRRHGVAFFQLMDIAAVCVPIALGLGRIANFINGELFGVPTTVSWGVIFPQGGPMPRHPTQLYEALMEGFVLCAILSVMWMRGGRDATDTTDTIHTAHATTSHTTPFIWRHHRGAISGAFLFFYGIFRFAIEFFKDPAAQSSDVFYGLTNGHLLCIPMIIMGVIFYNRGCKNAL